MLMLCWFYCIPFAKLLYFSSAPMLLVFAMFALKRGIRTSRSGLRQTAFVLMFLACVKMCLFDIRMLKKELLCGMHKGVETAACNATGFIAAEVLGLFMLVFSSAILFHFYRKYLHIRTSPLLTPEQVHLPRWTKMTLCSILLMVVWQLAPWVGYLTIGRIPGLFISIPWQALAVLNLGLLLIGFWKSESCVWNYDVQKKKQMAYLNATWTPRDTLWMSVFIYLLTLALSYVAHDVLAPKISIRF